MTNLPVYEKGPYWVLKTPKGFEVYKNGVIDSVRCATIGYKGTEGMRRAIAECERRLSQ